MSRWRYRPWQSAAVAALAALLTACAGFAPLHYRAMQQAVAELSLDRAVLINSSVQLSQSVNPSSVEPIPALTPEQVADRLPAKLRGLVEDPILSVATRSTLLAIPTYPPEGELTWRDRACEHITLTRGRCPEAAGEVAVSVADARNFDLHLGRTVPAARDQWDRQTYRLRVVGVFEPDASDFWIGHSVTGLSNVMVFEDDRWIRYHDSWLTARTTFERPEGPGATTSTAGFLVDRDRTDVDGLLALGDGVEELAADRDQPVRVTSALPSLADDVRAQIDQSEVTVPLLMAQLGLLAVVVLWLVLLALTEQRRPEVAVARLRGSGRRGAWGLLLGEVLPVTLAAVVPGAALAVLASWFARTVMLPGHAPFELGWSFLVALVLATVVLTVVPVLAAARVAREPVDRLLRRVPPRSSGWGLGATDAVVIAAAGGVTVVFATGGLDGPIALAAPGLLAIVVGLVVAHLTMPTAAILGRRLLRRGRVRAGVTALDAARSPATRRMVAMVTLATALATFSADALVVGQRNRAYAAQQEAGADLVATLKTTDLAGVRAALDEVDPDGTRMTPVVRVDPPGYDATPTLGVVPDAFRRIALFPGGGPDPALWDRVHGSDAAPIRLTGTELSVQAFGSTLDSQVNGMTAGSTHARVSVGVDLVLDSGETLEATLGELGHNTKRRSFSKRISCTQGCTLAAIWLRSGAGASVSGQVTLRDLVVGPSRVRVPFGTADEWVASSDSEHGVVASSSSADELTLSVEDTDLPMVTLQQAWLPVALPALVAGPLPSGSIGKQFALAGLDGESQAATEVGPVDRVPAAPAQVYVVDLDLLERGRRLVSTAHTEVWFADADPKLLEAVTAALAERGILIEATRTVSEIRRSYDESAAAWSLQLAVLVGAAALLIALLVMIVSAVSGWRRRARDLAALRMSGVPSRTATSMAVVAQLPAVVLGIVAGALSGLVGAHLAMPIIPLFPTDPAVSTLDLGTAWLAVGAAAVTAVVVLIGGCVLIGRLLASRASLGRLRETL